MLSHTAVVPSISLSTHRPVIFLIESKQIGHFFIRGVLSTPSVRMKDEAIADCSMSSMHPTRLSLRCFPARSYPFAHMPQPTIFCRQGPLTAGKLVRIGAPTRINVISFWTPFSPQCIRPSSVKFIVPRTGKGVSGTRCSPRILLSTDLRPISSSSNAI